MANTGTVVQVTDQAWTELTNANAALITAQVHRGEAYIRATAGAPPAELVGPLYPAGYGKENVTPSEFSPSTAGAVRVFAKSRTRSASVYVEHTDA